MKRIAILIDDDEISRKDTQFRLKGIKNLVLAGAFASVAEARAFFEAYPEGVDVIFCDIMMPDADGFEANKLFYGYSRSFVFLSQKTQFNDEPYQTVTPVSFLRKPVEPNKVREILAQLDDRDRERAATGKDRESLFFQENTTKENVRLRLSDILYINGHGDFIELVMKGNAKLTVDMSLTSAVQLLRKMAPFIRISNDCVVSVDAIDRVDKDLAVHLVNSEVKYVKRTYQSLFRKFLKNHRS